MTTLDWFLAAFVIGLCSAAAVQLVDFLLWVIEEMRGEVGE